MKQSIGVLFPLLAAAAFLAACNSNNNGVPSTGPTPSGKACASPPPSLKLKVVYPKNGARNIPDSLGSVYISTVTALPANNQWNFALQATTSFWGYYAGPYTGNFGVVSASQVPNPHLKPPYAHPIYYASALPGVPGPENTVELFWNNGGTGCTPIGPYGAFTTQ